MKLSELIAKVENLYPSEYDKDELTGWVSEVEFMAADQVYNKAEGPIIRFQKYKYDNDHDKELLIPDQFNGAYVAYLMTKIDYMNREIERYNMDAQQFEAEWQAFASWYRRTHRPRRLRRTMPEWHPEDNFGMKVDATSAINIFKKAVDDVINGEY